MASIRTVVIVAGFVVVAAIVRPMPVQTQSPTVQQLIARVMALESQVATLQTQVSALQAADVSLQASIAAEEAARAAADAALQQSINNLSVPQNLLDLANYVSVDTNTINDLVGPHVIFNGANVHIRNGSGATNGNPADPISVLVTATNGVGNLVLGYNETAGPLTRTGSHNLIVGVAHRYPAFGGIVVGRVNNISGPYASVIGGQTNTASGGHATIIGGASNTASADFASVTGGAFNVASGTFASVSGGQQNHAVAGVASISGGLSNTASGDFASVSGGSGNTASGVSSSVSGGTGITQTNDDGWSGGAFSTP